MFHQKRVLVVAAHPDDEVLGMGGTIVKLQERYEAEVHTLILGQGLGARDPQKTNVAAHLQAATEAQKILGYKKLYVEDLPDNRFDGVELLEIVQLIERHKAQVKPEIIFTHSPSDLNIDHRISAQAVLTATRPMETESTKAVIFFETPSATEWNFSGSFRPNFYMEINEQQMLKKAAALKAYASEIREFPHPRSEQYLRALAQVRGAESGNRLAEAFVIARMNG